MSPNQRALASSAGNQGPFFLSGGPRFEPATPSLGSPSLIRPAVHIDSQPSGFRPGAAPSPVQPFQPFAGARKPFVPALSPAAPGRLRAVDGGADRLLMVREAAERLAVSTATVYALCDRGELPHVRISNAIRIAPADLAAFLAGQRSGGR